MLDKEKHKQLKITTMALIIAILTLLTVFVGIPMLITKMSEENNIFTTLASGEMKFRQKGESLLEVLINILATENVNGTDVVVRKGIDEGGNIINAPYYKEPWLHKLLGVYLIGFPFFGRNLKEFDIQTGMIVTILENGQEKIEYLVRKVKSLWYEMNYTISIRNIELGDGARVDVDVNVRLRAINPYRMIYLLHGRFFQHAVETLKSEIITEIKNFETVDNFRDADKSETTGLLSHFKATGGEVNTTLKAQAGVEMFGISIPSFETSDSKVKEATLLAEITALENAALISKEQAKAEVVRIAATAQRFALEEEGHGKASQVASKIAALQAAGAEPHSILQVLITENLSQLQYLGGDGVSILLNKN